MRISSFCYSLADIVICRYIFEDPVRRLLLNMTLSFTFPFLLVRLMVYCLFSSKDVEFLTIVLPFPIILYCIDKHFVRISNTFSSIRFSIVIFPSLIVHLSIYRSLYLKLNPLRFLIIIFEISFYMTLIIDLNLVNFFN